MSKALLLLRGNRQRQPRFADDTRSDNGQQATFGIGEQIGQFVDFGLAPDQRGSWAGEGWAERTFWTKRGRRRRRGGDLHCCWDRQGWDRWYGYEPIHSQFTT